MLLRNKAIGLTMGIFLLIGSVPAAGAAQADKGKAAVPETKDVARKIVAFYFHGNFRCDSCKKIEQYSREAIEKYFSEQLKIGELVWQVVNTDLPANQHFMKDYQLYTSSLVIAEFKGSTQLQWKNLAGVWHELDDQEAFYDYVKTEIQKFLEST
jgi:hypothetical protein